MLRTIPRYTEKQIYMIGLSKLVTYIIRKNNQSHLPE